MTEEKTAGEAIPDEAQLLIGEVMTEEEQQQQDSSGSSQVYNSQMAEMDADFILDLSIEIIEGAHPAIQYDDEVRKKLKARLIPLLIKYDGKLPPWFEAWKLEIMFAFTLSSVAYGTVKSIREYERDTANAAKRGGADGS